MKALPSRIGQLVELRDWFAIAGLVRERFEVEVHPVDVGKWLLQARRELVEGKGHWRKWSDGTWFCFLKNRLRSRGVFIPTGPLPFDFERWSGGELHFFFITLEETEQHLARLPEGWRRKAAPARPKISKSNLAVIEPIDATAARVRGRQ